MSLGYKKAGTKRIAWDRPLIHSQSCSMTRSVPCSPVSCEASGLSAWFRSFADKREGITSSSSPSAVYNAVSFNLRWRLSLRPPRCLVLCLLCPLSCLTATCPNLALHQGADSSDAWSHFSRTGSGLAEALLPFSMSALRCLDAIKLAWKCLAAPGCMPLVI